MQVCELYLSSYSLTISFFPKFRGKNFPFRSGGLYSVPRSYAVLTFCLWQSFPRQGVIGVGWMGRLSVIQRTLLKTIWMDSVSLQPDQGSWSNPLLLKLVLWDQESDVLQGEVVWCHSVWTQTVWSVNSGLKRRHNGTWKVTWINKRRAV